MIPLSFAVSGYIFPALIAALIPVRTYIVSWMFDEDDLRYLDPMDEAFTPPGKDDNDDDDEKKENQNCYSDFASEHYLAHHVQGGGIDESSLPHGFAEYRGQHPDEHHPHHCHHHRHKHRHPDGEAAHKTY
jgi:hypothetical protein